MSITSRKKGLFGGTDWKIIVRTFIKIKFSFLTVIDYVKQQLKLQLIMLKSHSGLSVCSIPECAECCNVLNHKRRNILVKQENLYVFELQSKL